MAGDNCVACKHISYFEDVVKLVRDEDVAVKCGKGVWELDAYKDTNDDFTRYWIMARECDMYENK